MIKKIYRSFGVAAVLLFLYNFAFAQSKVVTGTVKDATGSGMPGVNVLIKDTMNGTSTDPEGNFSLDASPADVLVFSFIGYISQKVPVGSQTRFDIVLTEDLTTLIHLNKTHL